ncbi:MAG: 4Fe-4S binding protein [Synergistaceae bacterium]|nr:4Fe-4S binding protein [Synergistaceae bacterium]
MAAFLYFYHGFGAVSDAFGDMMNWQFSARAVGVGATGGAVVLFLALAAVFGRVFCSAFCPMGALQEFVWRISAKLKISRTKYISVRGWRCVAVLSLAAAGLLAAVPPFFILLDPISNFGRGITSLTLLLRGERAPGLIAVCLMFLAILLCACLWGRRFCDWCPAGMTLGIVSSVAPLALRLDKARCVSCGVCERACPMNCADASNKKIDRERCVLCMACAASCPGSFIGYGRAEGLVCAGRRSFIRNGINFLLAAAYVGARNVRDALRHSDEAMAGSGSLILPPGAGAEDEFASRCVACQACVHACPVGIISAVKSPQPRIVYGADYCQFSCVECGKVCPTNAIARLDVETKRRTRIALSSLTLSRCLVVAKNQACGACAEVCPTHALVMVPYEGGAGLTVPNFDKEYCIGCGACFCVCPAEPVAFEIRGESVQGITPGMRAISEDAADAPGPKPMTAEDDFPF